MNSRLIKFRVWDGWEFSAPRIYLPKYEAQYLDINRAIQSEDAIWMQFTGIVDKNGRDVYECDEVVATPIRSSSDPTIRGVVEYDELAARFMVRHDRGLTKLDANHFALEVVGNAFQR